MNLQTFAEYVRVMAVSGSGADTELPEELGLIVISVENGDATTTEEGDHVAALMLDKLRSGYHRYLEGLGARDDQPLEEAQGPEFVNTVGTCGGIIPYPEGTKVSRPTLLVALAMMLGKDNLNQCLAKVRSK